MRLLDSLLAISSLHQSTMITRMTCPKCVLVSVQRTRALRQATNWASRAGLTEIARTTLGMSQWGVLGEIGSGILGGVYCECRREKNARKSFVYINCSWSHSLVCVLSGVFCYLPSIENTLCLLL